MVWWTDDQNLGESLNGSMQEEVVVPEYEKNSELMAKENILTYSFLKFHGHKIKPR
jgi:hypothetical protein